MRSRIFFGDVSPASSDVTLALTGQAVTCSAGTLGVSTSIALSGQAATVSAGTLTPSMAFALTGSAVTASAGTLGVSTSLALSGQALTASAGTLTPSMAFALLGETVTASAGTLSDSQSADGPPPHIVSDGTFIWNWLYGKRRKVAEELDEEVAEAAEQVAEVVKDEIDPVALEAAVDRLEKALADAVKRNKSLVERALYAQMLHAIEEQQARLRALQIERLEAHLAMRAAYTAMVDAEARELLDILSLIE